MSGNWAKGSTPRWRRIRRAVILRDQAAGWGCRAHEDGWCRRSNARPHECTHRADLSGPYAGHAHHTHGRAVTGDDPRFIVAACEPCNLAIGDPTRNIDPPAHVRSTW